MAFDHLLWSIIGEKETCSFLRKRADNKFCTNRFNSTGLCREVFCPLVNSDYFTVTKKRGKIFLAQKVNLPGVESSRVVSNFEYTELPADSNEGIKIIQEKMGSQTPKRITDCQKKYLMFVNYYKNKVNRKQRSQKQKNIFLVGIKNREERKLIKYEQKALRKAKIEQVVKEKLLDRLENGIYEGIYIFQQEYVGEEIKTTATDRVKNFVEEVESEEAVLDIEEIKLKK